MPLIELNIRFPTHNQVIVKFEDDETELLDFKSPVSKKDLDDLRWYIETYGAQYTGEPDDEEARRIEAKLKTLGDALFNAVFTTPNAQTLFQQFQQQSTDKLLTIQTDEPEILALPWELLRDPHSNFLCQQQPRISIRRHCVKNLPASFTIQAKPKLRLLFVVSRPNNVSFLDPRLDPQAVLDALAEQEISQIEVEFLRPATFFNLKKRLNNKDLPPIDIIHFDGHGFYDEKKQLGYLLFETPRGLREDYSASELSEILVLHQVALVVLSACQSAAVGNKALGSVAAGLTDKSVPTVLAMVYSVLVATTRQLFAAFYQALATGQGIGSALDHARLALASQNKRGTRRRGEGEFELTLQDWFVPALYQTNHDDALLLKDLRGFENLAGLSISNLPTLQAAGFFGRSRELWQIERWFVQDVERITLTGFGGQGKTYCAIEAAHWLLRTDLFDSVCFVDFSRYQGLDALRYAMNALGVLLDTTLLDENAVPPILQTRRLLWVWDNLESLATETLDELLTVAVQWSTHSRFLFTTRQHRFTQADYAESNPKHQYLDLAGLAELDALAYFNQLWQTAPPPELTFPARYELITLFNKVAFHPLSIGLLAQQLKTRTIAELGERLEALLLCEPENSEDKSLLASLKLSLERLSPKQQALIKQLGVFQGGGLEGMILAIANINEADWNKLRDALENIGLLQIESLNRFDVSKPFIKFHPVLCPYLWQEFNTSKKQNFIARYWQAYKKNGLIKRYCKTYYDFSAWLYNEDKKNPDTIRAIVRRELPNLLYAVYATLQASHGEFFVMDFMDNVVKFLNNFGLQRDKSALIEQAQCLNYKDDRESWYVTLGSYGWQLFNEEKYLEAGEIFDDILKRLNKTGWHPYERGVTLGRLGRCLHFQGKPTEAITRYKQALAIEEHLASQSYIKRHIGILHGDLAAAFTENRDYKQARNHYNQSLAVAKVMNDKYQLSVIQIGLGILAKQQNNLSGAEGAEEYFKKALELSTELDDLQNKAKALYLLGEVYINYALDAAYNSKVNIKSVELDNLQNKTKALWVKSEEYFRESADIKESIGNLIGTAKTWGKLALVSYNQGKLQAAEDWHKAAIKVQRKKVPHSLDLVSSLQGLAELLQIQSIRLSDAEQLALEALEIKKTLNPNTVEIWTTYSILADIATKQHKFIEAKQYRQLERDSYFQSPNMLVEMRESAPLIASVINGVFDLEYQTGLRTELIQYLKTIDEIESTGLKEYADVIKLIFLILNGERDETKLIEPLHYIGATTIHLILKGIENPKSLDSFFKF